MRKPVLHRRDAETGDEIEQTVVTGARARRRAVLERSTIAPAVRALVELREQFLSRSLDARQARTSTQGPS